ncbi:MAG: hypothetical protein EPO65_07660 [Dehalococcoidia bacterium]|nr:MAG: hypothetical protein EPO65_07660 [Dehalococcoidia bacterium]
MDHPHRILIALDGNGDVPFPTFTQREDVGDGTAWITIPGALAPDDAEDGAQWIARLAHRYDGATFAVEIIDHDAAPLAVREGDRVVLVARGEAADRAKRRAAEAKAADDAFTAFLAAEAAKA